MGAIYVGVTIRNLLDSKRGAAAEYVLADGKPVSLDITTAEIEFEGQVGGGTIVCGDEVAEPLLGTTALDSGGFEVNSCNGELKRLSAVLLKACGTIGL